MTIQQNLFSKFFIQGFVGFSFFLFISIPVKAQIIPDNTLGAENSHITPGALVNGVSADKIDGGAQRGSNLFHSFSEFNINNGQRVYFSNPTGIENILTRVTGGKISNILGTLGVDGAANLFLINPNGILFGQNSQLDIRGSFVGTTASGVQFGEQGIFSTTNPQAPPLLTINPSALFFNQINPEAKIDIQSQASAGINPIGNQTNGLRVPDGKSLLLVGGDINLTSTGLRAYGGKVELAGLAAPGTVGLTGNGTQLGLVIPSDVTRANVSIIDSAISGFAGTAGEISIYGRNLDIAGTGLYGGIGDGLGFIGAKAGNIKLDATDTITLRQESIIDGNLGKNAIGNTGNIQIKTGSLNVLEGSIIRTASLGQGNAGNVLIDARDSVTVEAKVLDGTKSGSILSSVGADTSGQSGDIQINTGSLLIKNGGALLALNGGGKGNAGNILVNARDGVTFDNGTASTQLSSNGIGQGGNIQINAGFLEMKNGSSLGASTGGEGNAGSITINTRDAISLSDKSSIFNSVISGGKGNAGDIRVNGASLGIAGGSYISSSTNGQGNGGNIVVNAGSALNLDGESSLLITGVGSSGVGKSGDIQISADSLSLKNGAALITSTAGIGDSGNIQIKTDSVSVARGTLISATGGKGNAGNILINAQDHVTLDGQNSGLSSAVFTNGIGQGGNIEISTGSLLLKNGGSLSASTSGQGNAGNIIVNARDQVELSGKEADTRSLIFNSVLTNGRGNAGEVRIKAGSLRLADGAFISTNTNGKGDGGNIRADVDSSINIDGAGSALLSGINNQGVGQGGNIQLNAGSLSITNRGVLSSETSGKGNAGNIQINTLDGIAINKGGFIASNTLGLGNAGSINLKSASGIVIDGGWSLDFPSGIFATVSSINLPTKETVEARNGGDINIDAHSLTLANRGFLNASTNSIGNAGSIFVKVDDGIALTGESQIRATVEAGGVGNAGDIDLRARSLLVDQSQIGASLFRTFGNSPGGIGKGGDIRINASDSVTVSGIFQSKESFGFGSAILTTTGRGAIGQAGNIDINTSNLRVSGGAAISAETSNTEPGGNITINIRDFAALNGGQVLTNTSGSGQAGKILLNASGGVIVAGQDSQFEQRVTGLRQRLQEPNVTDRIEDVFSSISPASGLFATTSINSTGAGGNLTVNTPQLTVRDGAQITVTSQGKGDAGTINANTRLTLLDNQGKITAETTTGQGGNINLSADALALFRNSKISTTAGTADQGGGNGGNILINAGSIVAIPKENSDISANAFAGRGGNVTINTQGVFGITPGVSPTPQSDITASSQLGLQGQVNINQPNVQSTPGLVQLQAQVADASKEIAQVCPKRADGRLRGEFYVVGRNGSLPPSPFEPLTGSRSLSELASLDGASSNVVSAKSNIQGTLPTQVVEAQGFVRMPDGQIHLVAEAREATPSAATTSPGCAGMHDKRM